MDTRAAMAAEIGQLLDGQWSNTQAITWLRAHTIETLTPETLAGAVDAVMQRALPCEPFPDAFDCCGTGGDGLHTYNISTAAAFVIAACGVRVAKHGNRAVSSASGSADVLVALGVRTDITAAHAAELLRKVGIAFLFAPQFHPGFKHVAAARKAIGTRTVFNLLGPLCNPAGVTRQLIGVFDASVCALVAETAKLLGRQSVLVVHGADGLDEVSITGDTHAVWLQGGALTTTTLHPADAGLSPAPLAAIIGGDAAHNARTLREMLAGTTNAYADAVLLNAAASLMVAAAAPNLPSGVALARRAIADGSATRILNTFISRSHDHV